MKTGGFFATRFVDARDYEDACAKAKELVLRDGKLTDMTDITRVSSAIKIEESEEVSWFRRRLFPATGFTFVLPD
jgi:hypothetical protein